VELQRLDADRGGERVGEDFHAAKIFMP